MARPQHHRDGGREIRHRHDEADLEIAHPAETLDDLRQPERDCVEAGDKAEIEQAQPQHPVVGERLGEPVLAHGLAVRPLARERCLEPCALARR
jgi:hypothetical protein